MSIARLIDNRKVDDIYVPSSLNISIILSSFTVICTGFMTIHVIQQQHSQAYSGLWSKGREERCSRKHHRWRYYCRCLYGVYVDNMTVFVIQNIIVAIQITTFFIIIIFHYHHQYHHLSLSSSYIIEYHYHHHPPPLHYIISSISLLQFYYSIIILLLL